MEIPKHTRQSIEKIRVALDSRMDDIIDASSFILPDGETGYSPVGYRGVWMRDMYYLVSAAGKRIPNRHLAEAVERFLRFQRDDGTVPMRITGDNTPGYACFNVPGGFDAVSLPLDKDWTYWNGQGPKPETDSAQFLVLMAYAYWMRSGDNVFIDRTLQALNRAMTAMPRNARGLIWIDPAWPHTPYGFHDNVGITGAELFSSLLYWEAARKLAQMASALGESGLMHTMLQQAECIEKNLDDLKDPETGAYWAGTENCQQIDVWGNAYLVYIGFPDEARRTRICRFLAERYADYTRHGQIRQILHPECWQRTFRYPTGEPYPRDRYQNGGYWAMAAGWIAWALAQVEPGLASALLEDLVSFFAAETPYECINADDEGQRPHYAASVALPLAACRRLLNEDVSTPPASLSLPAETLLFKPSRKSTNEPKHHQNPL